MIFKYILIIFFQKLVSTTSKLDSLSYLVSFPRVPNDDDDDVVEIKIEKLVIGKRVREELKTILKVTCEHIKINPFSLFQITYNGSRSPSHSPYIRSYQPRAKLKLRRRRIFNYLMPCEWMSVDEIAIFHYTRGDENKSAATDWNQF